MRAAVDPVRALDQDGASASAAPAAVTPALAWVGYLVAGVLLGIVFAMSEVLSWYRIQEMFRFQSWHMYGVIGGAVVVAAAGQAWLRWSRARTLDGAAIVIPDKVRTPSNARYWLGGYVFGLGWALLGACPGPIFALLGMGYSIYVVPLAAAVAGTYLYGVVKDRLPH